MHVSVYKDSTCKYYYNRVVFTLSRERISAESREKEKKSRVHFVTNNGWLIYIYIYIERINCKYALSCVATNSDGELN